MITENSLEIIELNDSTEYDKIINSYHCFNKAEFSYINRNKTDHIVYLIFKDKKKTRGGIVGGIKNNTFYFPFSAPFGGFSYNNNDIKIQQIENMVMLLEKWCRSNGIENIFITLPPEIYDTTFISKTINTCYRNDYILENIELNYYFDTKNIQNQDNYLEIIPYSARKSLKRSLRENLLFIQAKTLDETKEAYDIIKINRTAKGYPLRMDFEDIISTNKIIKKDFFIVKKEMTSIGAAVVYHITNTIVQVVYWGDIPTYSKYRVINFLSYKLFEYYRNIGIKYVDVGPSTENSIPNYGLCEFKENIGCDVVPKYIFKKILNKDEL